MEHYCKYKAFSTKNFKKILKNFINMQNTFLLFPTISIKQLPAFMLSKYCNNRFQSSIKDFKSGQF